MSTNDRPLMNIHRLGSTQCTLASNVATELTNGAGQNFAQAPQWATKLRGIWVNNVKFSTAVDQPLSARGWLESDDSVHLKPFHFLFPEIGAADAAVDCLNPTRGEFYPINADVKPGSRIKAYYLHDVTQTAPPGGSTYPYAWIDFVWSNDVAKNPSHLDSMPDTQRYRIVNTRTTDLGWEPTIAAPGRANAALYSFSEGSFITELCGNVHLTTYTTAVPGVGRFYFESNEVPLFPAHFHANAEGSVLDATCRQSAQGVTRRPVMAQVVRDNCNIDTYFLNGAANALAALGCWITGVEFIR